MGIDKFLAGRGRVRLSESAILTIAAFGAGPGMWAAIFFFRHKTRKKMFLFGAFVGLVTSIGIYILTHGGRG